jgi:pyruvate carboxylase subunit B
MVRTYVIGDNGTQVVVRGKGPVYEISHGGSTESVQVLTLPDGRLSLLLASGRQICGRASKRGPAELELSTPRGVLRLRATDPLRARLAATRERESSAETESEEVRALMPGRIVEVAVALGDSVESGNLLLVLEAMKMQNELRATRSGVVTQCVATPGQTVEAGALLVTIHPEPAGMSSPAGGGA